MKDDKCSQLAFRPKPHSTISSEAYVNHLALRSAPHTRVRRSSNRRYGVLLYRVYRIMSLALTGCMRVSAGPNCRTIAPFCRKDDERYAAITLVRGEAMMSTMTRKQVMHHLQPFLASWASLEEPWRILVTIARMYRCQHRPIPTIWLVITSTIT